MSWIIMFILFLSTALLQSALPGFRIFAQARFPFLLSFVLFYALTRKGAIVLFAAFLAGLLQDSLSIAPLGYSAFLFSVAALIATRFRNLVVPDSPVTAAFFGGVASVLVSAFLYFLFARAELVSCGLGIGLVRVLGTGLMGMICTPFVFYVANELHRCIDVSDKRESPNAIG